ncbi:MAG: response regulator [Candidatus Hydrogenedens sp.]|nr:response regulator [Candidatus Hydrogenedens sp.]
MASHPHILVVDDELGMREVLEIVLSNAGYEVTLANNPAEAIAHLSKQSFDTVLTDLYMGTDREAGIKVLEWIQENAPTTPALMMTAHGSVELAVEAMKLGAADYIQKPFKNDEICLRVERTVGQRNLMRENEAYRTAQSRDAKVDFMVGRSPVYQEVLGMVRRVARLPSTVAIHGESGAGKELVARALHELSDRRNKPFVAINCGGIPETLLESELFGYKKGAFTGANENKEGLFVSANGGTLFLDEIGEMPLMLQVKLLRVLDNSLVTPVGGTTSTKVDVRIVSATNRDLEAMSNDGDFRSDLFYRLNVIPIVVPPLRERKEDIALLARHFIERHAERMGRAPVELSAEAVRLLEAYPWPGNVRELGNVMERTLALCMAEAIRPEDLPASIRLYAPSEDDAAAGGGESGNPFVLPDEGMNLEGMVEEMEKTLITQALQRSRYTQKKAAALLGLTPRSLRYRLQKYGLE